MLNVEHFKLLAGNPDELDRELIEKAKTIGLVAAQEQQFNEGRRSACLYHAPSPIFKREWWVALAISINADPKLKSFATRDGAIEWGKAWANEEPNKREFYARNTDLGA